MRLADCQPVPDSFLAWVESTGGWKLHDSLTVEATAIGAVVTSYTGEWAMIGVRGEDERGAGVLGLYLTQNPLGGPETMGGTTLIPADDLTQNTRGRGGLLALGEEAAAAALACVS
jgi:hypothetical protein